MRPHAALLALALASCAAHNSHLVELAPEEELGPLVDQALEGMQASFGGPLPTRLAFDVQVEPVVLHWVRPGFPVEPEAIAAADDLRPILLDALAQRLGAPADVPDAVLVAALQIDLHVPSAVALRIASALYEPEAEGRLLAEAFSGPLRRERLYCHGCRERWGGKGTRIGGSVYVAGGYWPVVPIYVPYCSPSPGYVKQ